MTLEGSKKRVPIQTAETGGPVSDAALLVNGERPIKMQPKIHLSSSSNDLSYFQEWYKNIEQKLQIDDQDNLSHLCDSKDNDDLPVYSWYNLKEAFSENFSVWVLDYLRQRYQFSPKTMLDPYCGGATSILSLKRQGINCVGIEYNPFISWVAHTKVGWETYDIKKINKCINTIDFNAKKLVVVPDLTTLHNSEYFNEDKLQELLNLLLQIKDLDCEKSTKDFLSIGLASIIEEISNLSKDGRALRYKSKNSRTSIKELALIKWQTNLNHLRKVQKLWQSQFPCKILSGTATDYSTLRDGEGKCVNLAENSFDLILYSPPYLNNFDYSEVYKLELWIMGFINSYDQWKELRKGTIRSHHSVKFTKTSFLKDDAYTQDLSEFISRLSSSNLMSTKRKTTMPEVILGYFDDLFISMMNQYKVLKPGGFLVYNVANSKHGELPIQTDLILAEVAIRVGFRPLNLIPLRNLNGRTSRNSRLRESVVILRKPL